MQTDPSPISSAALANRLLAEQLIYFGDVARRFPMHSGRRLHVGTLARWRDRGVAGVRLEAVRVGGRWMTSWEAVDRFVTATSSSRTNSYRPTPDPRVPTEVDQELDEAGI